MSTKINSLKENFSFELLDYEIEHQGQAVIDIAVDMDYKEGIGQENPFEYPDFIPIAEFIDNGTLANFKPKQTLNSLY
ncbi:MAG: hypothetical protein O4751_01510, partial [Trichodesmium sp. St2_bin6]|nr:hypothetical protein [Trichodesmium sp. St2_bin6]